MGQHIQPLVGVITSYSIHYTKLYDRKAVLEQSMGAERESLLANLKEGATVKGIVKNITEYGAFVDLGGIDGLLHITDLAWRRVKHPTEVVNVGDEVSAMVLKFDQEKNRVSLGSYNFV